MNFITERLTLQNTQVRETRETKVAARFWGGLIGGVLTFTIILVLIHALEN